MFFVLIINELREKRSVPEPVGLLTFARKTEIQHLML